MRFFSSSRALLRHSWPAMLAVASLILAWETYVQLSSISPTTLPAPSRVLAQGYEQRATLAVHTLATLQATIVGFAASLCAAFVFSVVVDFSPACAGLCFPSS